MGARVDPWPRAAVVLATLAIGAIAGLVFRGALGYYFSQDDFAGLARATGLLPQLTGPWRWLSHQAFFDVLWRVAGPRPYPYHLASLVAHVASAMLLFLLLRRRFSPAAAFLGAGFFATHPTLFTAVYWISANGEILAAGFGLAAVACTLAEGRKRWLAVPLFVLSLLSKESTLALPLALPALLVMGGRDAAPRRRPWRDPLPYALALVSLFWLGVFVAGNRFGVRLERSAVQPYALDFGASVWRNLLTYAGWTVDFPIPLVRHFSDAIEPGVFPAGALVLLVWVAGLFLPGLRDRGWAAGGAAFLLLLAPVLPLRNHTYHYYLYAPLTGAALCLTAATDRIAARRARWAPLAPRVVWIASLVLVGALTLNAQALVRKIETMPFVVPELRSDPTVDRARIARNAIADLVRADLPAGTALRFWSPESQDLERNLRGAEPEPGRETYYEQNVRTALLDGLAVRVMLPQVTAVRFVRTFDPVPAAERYAVYRHDCMLRVVTPAFLDSVLSTGRTPR